MKLPLLTSLPDIPFSSKPMDMHFTKVVSFVALSPTFASSMGIPHPLMKHKLENYLTSSNIPKKFSSSLESCSTLAYAILVTEATLTSLEFVTTPLPEDGSDSRGCPILLLLR